MPRVLMHRGGQCGRSIGSTGTEGRDEAQEVIRDQTMRCHIGFNSKRNGEPGSLEAEE